MVLNAKNIEEIPSKDIKVVDDAEEKRVELTCSYHDECYGWGN